MDWALTRKRHTDESADHLPYREEREVEQDSAEALCGGNHQQHEVDEWQEQHREQHRDSREGQGHHSQPAIARIAEHAPVLPYRLDIAIHPAEALASQRRYSLWRFSVADRLVVLRDLVAMLLQFQRQITILGER